LHHVSDRIYSGSEPEGEIGFSSLQELGVKTIVSVDGAKPRVELARRHGLKYVHIPIGYDGISREAGAALTRVVRDAEQPIYIHCHHGKHRGPAAAAVACIAAGKVDSKLALEILVRAGTSKDYSGLWRDVEAYQPPAPGEKLPELVEVAQVDSLTAAMSQVDRAFDNLKLCRDAKWADPPDHPDLVPVQEAIQLQEGFHEAGRTLDSDRPELGREFKSWLADAEMLATQMKASLDARNSAAAGVQLTRLEQGCKHCHNKYRDK
jgi:protein tyrosine phosphatase (PTP) superfamily phosphohydrolase (DUF442 family)